MPIYEKVKRPIPINYGFFLNSKNDLIYTDSDDESIEVETFHLDKIPDSLDKIFSANYSPNLDKQYKLDSNFNDVYEMNLNYINKKRKEKYKLIFNFLIILTGIILYPFIALIVYLYLNLIYKSNRW